MKLKLKILFPLLIAASLLGCSTVDLPNSVVNPPAPNSAPTSEVSSVPTSAPSSTPTSEATSVQTSVATSVPTSTATSAQESKPAATSAPAKKPTATSATVKKPVATSAPVSKPVTSAPASSAPTVQTDYSSEMQADMSGIEDDILALVNNLRAELGVHALTKNSSLKSSAFVRSREMALNDTFSHTRPNQTKFYTAIDEVGYKYKYVAENLAFAEGLTRQEYAERFFLGWKESPSHYQAMISEKTFETGVSLYEYNGKLYGTQHFGDPAK